MNKSRIEGALSSRANRATMRHHAPPRATTFCCAIVCSFKDGDGVRDERIVHCSLFVVEATREAVDTRTLDAEIGRIAARQAKLREQIDAIVADLEGEIA